MTIRTQTVFAALFAIALVAGAPASGALAAPQGASSQGASSQGDVVPRPLDVPGGGDNGGSNDWDVGEEMC